jgi:hypothetical protein
MEKSRIKTFLLSLFATSLCLWNVTCSTYPVDTSKRDILEIERVWQYLKAYSIWQDWPDATLNKVPKNVFDPDTFETPQQVFKSIHDTLGCWNPTFGRVWEYTGYYDTITEGILPKSLASFDWGNTVIAIGLTQKTVRLIIRDHFAHDSTFNLFQEYADALSRYSNIIIDIRNNGGGDINAVDSLLEYFLPAQTSYLNATYRKYDELQRTAQTVSEIWKTHAERSPSLVNKHLAILFNTGSASASEMLIAGLKDGRASGDTVVLVGERSYGKGMGQIVISRSYLNRPDIKITFLRVVRACGCAEADYHRKGIKPDLTVVNTISRDVQLDSALQRLEPGAAKLLQTIPTPCLTNVSAEGYKVISPISSIEK